MTDFFVATDAKKQRVCFGGFVFQGISVDELASRYGAAFASQSLPWRHGIVPLVVAAKPFTEEGIGETIFVVPVKNDMVIQQMCKHAPRKLRSGDIITPLVALVATSGRPVPNASAPFCQCFSRRKP